VFENQVLVVERLDLGLENLVLDLHSGTPFSDVDES
jgi:hypothetical protein